MSDQKNWPLSLVVRYSGQVDLLDADEERVWTSDGDDEFVEFIDTDIPGEEDIGEILSYLEDNDILTEDEIAQFENENFEIFIEEADGDEDEESDGDLTQDDTEEEEDLDS